MNNGDIWTPTAQEMELAEKIQAIRPDFVGGYPSINEIATLLSAERAKEREVLREIKASLVELQEKFMELHQQGGFLASDNLKLLQQLTERSKQCGVLTLEIDKCWKEIAELRKDKERLDWLELKRGSISLMTETNTSAGWLEPRLLAGETVRAAIDSAQNKK